jgi:hypothetical protein
MPDSHGILSGRLRGHATRIIQSIGHRSSPYSDEEFVSELRTSLKQAAEWGLAKGVNGMRTFDDKKFQDELLSQAHSTRGIQESYAAMRTRYELMCTERANEAWAAFTDRVQALCFRMATGIGIAAIILATGWLAQHWNIPIPLLRIIP